MSRRDHKLSAYLSIYNDWDILPSALKSFAPYVDELVVVDGAYEWMRPYLEALGADPERSDARVYDALESCGIPYRVLNRTWDNEIQKRVAGFDACSHRLIFRFDADEIVFFDDRKLESHLAGDSAIAQMEISNYVAPGWILRNTDLAELPRLSFLFDRNRISADIHLNYLWLVLEADDLPRAGQTPFLPDIEPVAFNAHLTHWRRPETAVNRASFYVMNWMRKNGAPWLPEMRSRPIADFRELFLRLPATDLRGALLRGNLTMGAKGLSDHEYLGRSPLPLADEMTFSPLHGEFLDGLAALIREARSSPCPILWGEPFWIDLSSEEARNAAAPNGKIELVFPSHLSSASAKSHTVRHSAPHYAAENATCAVQGNRLSIDLPSPDETALRSTLEITCFGEANALSSSYRLI